MKASSFQQHLALVLLFLQVCPSWKAKAGYAGAQAGSNTSVPTAAAAAAAPLSMSSLPVAYFIFGDSLVDAGNNNYITTVAKANSLPFGIDFPSGPTGRFTNGKIVPDYLCEHMGIPYPPPYLAPTTRTKALLQGVNYGSAAAGILPSTGYNFIGRVGLDTQITWFANNVLELEQLMGREATQQLLAESLFTITIGSNDFINNYLLNTSPLRLRYNMHDFHQLLLAKLASQLTTLYNMGARRVAMPEIGPLGCVPSQLAKARSVNGECVESVNEVALQFNAELGPLFESLNTQLPGAKFLLVKSYDLVLDMRTNPPKYGFKVGDKACCGGGRYNGQLLCLPVVRPCPNRQDYVFFDCFHPAQGPNKIMSDSFFKALAVLFS